MILNGKIIAEKKFEKLKEIIKEKVYLKNKLLNIVYFSNDKATNIYVKNQEKKCKELGIKFHKIDLSSWDDIGAIRKAIIRLVKASYSNERFVFIKPFHNELNLEFLKSINELHDIEIEGIVNPNKIPCTVLAILELIKEYKINIKGKNVVLLNRSEIIGKPLAKILIDMGATLTVCNSYTENLKMFTEKADLIITATGKINLINKDMVKENCYIIDASINTVNGKIYGDSNFEELESFTNITPVPSGVGPLTNYFLFHNLLGLEDEI